MNVLENDSGATRTSRLEEALTLPARDGYALRATHFWPEKEGGSALLVGSATGVPRGYYARFARFMAKRGHHVLTVDYRGIGDSAPKKLRGFRARMRDWGALDLAGALDWIDRTIAPTRRLFIGHSVAGQLLGLVPNASTLDAAYLVGSQSGHWRHWDGKSRAKMVAFWYAILPATVATLGYLPGRVVGGGEDLPAGVAREWGRWGRHPKYILGARPEAREGYARLRMPTMFASIEDDDFAPARAVDELSRWFGAPSVRRTYRPRDLGVDEVGHFGFFRPKFEASLWQDAAAFLEERREGNFE